MAKAVQEFHLQHNTEQHWGIHVHAALSSPKICQCFETFSPPEVHNFHYIYYIKEQSGIANMAVC